ncbi:MAG: hypothetical protein IPF53_06165 [Blastocatellia bacterium]|jgi:hypothetical protein|nr:hypothetical protein [Blastocatellia bacterium]MBK6424724.1 hypothetical protein [Blastocatellia bacterium]
MLSNSSASRNRRKGPRRYLKLKIVLSGSDALGETFTETTETRVVTKEGGSLITTRRLRIGSTLRVSTPDGKFNAPATIRNSRHDAHTNTYQCGFCFEEDVHGWVLR